MPNPTQLLAMVMGVLDRIPIEKLLVKPPDRSRSREELKEILQRAPVGERPRPEPRPQVTSQPHSAGASLADTVMYQKREIAKLLLRMERHYAQRLRINGIPCDCGSTKHLLDLESLCEETVPMVKAPSIYYEIVEWVKKVGPLSTEDSAKSGLYDDEYPVFSGEARDFRKQLIGTLDVAVLFPPRQHKADKTDILPVMSDAERAEVKKRAHLKIDEVLESGPELVESILSERRDEIEPHQD